MSASTKECPGCPHVQGDHDQEGCSYGGCPCKLNGRGKPGGPTAKKAKRADDLRSRLEALAERGRPNGPALREVADEASELLDYLQSAVDRLDELAGAADDYENAEEGRDGAEDRADAWERAQEAATELQSALDDIDATLNAGVEA